MIEFLFDISNINIDYTLYVGILLGLTVKFFWLWSSKFKYIQTIDPSSPLHMHQLRPFMQRTCQMYRNNLLIWIVKYIRRKVIPSDESDSFPFPFIEKEKNIFSRRKIEIYERILS